MASRAYRTALQVAGERICRLRSHELAELVGRLLVAQARRCRSPAGDIRLNTEPSAADDGCDAWSGRGFGDAWLGAEEGTCWQFKAGKAGQPNKLRGEISKPIPRKTLAEGGRVVVIASGSVDGKKGEDARLEVLRKEARALNIPAENIEVIGSERLTLWCNQHPAIAAEWAGRPSGLLTLDDWLSSDEHQTPWQAAGSPDVRFDSLRANIEPADGSVLHLHIKGPPGVGKSRFALELCREASWRDAVVYVAQAADPRLVELLEGAVHESDVILVLVADEAQHEQLASLRQIVGRGKGRVRLITIGHSDTPDPSRIHPLEVSPLAYEQMRAVIKGEYDSMPPEHVEFVSRFADGYVRLGLLAAGAVARNPATTTLSLVNVDEIRKFLDRMLGTGDRQALHVLAVMTKVGWYDDLMEEGQKACEHFGLDWDRARADVHRFHERFSIAPRGGRYRYISPTPLAIYLAAEACEIYPDRVKTLADALPTEDARDAYFERLGLLAGNAHVRQVARTELRFFFELEHFVDPRAARRWSALAAADPALAADLLASGLARASLDQRLGIRDQARRHIVSALVKLAWGRQTFTHAVSALALLAEAENETWANNATAEFIARFQPFLGGTAASYVERLDALSALVEIGRPGILRLVIRALAKAGGNNFFRTGIGPGTPNLPEPEWQPTRAQRFEAFEQAIRMLCALAGRVSNPDLVESFLETARELSKHLSASFTRALVAQYFDSVRTKFPTTREPLRRLIADVLRREQKRESSEQQDRLDLEVLHATYEDNSLAARLSQHVGTVPAYGEAPTDLTALAQELLEPDVLEQHWAWLTSPEAANGWHLGSVMTSLDAPAITERMSPLLADRGTDMRFISGCLHALRESNGLTWYETWLKNQLGKRPEDHLLLVETIWRCGVTDDIASILAKTIREQVLPGSLVGRLEYGSWSNIISSETFASVLTAMMERGHESVAAALLEHRLQARSHELDSWKPLILQLATTPTLIRMDGMTGYNWRLLAQRIVPEYASRLAEAIVQEHASRGTTIWFIEHSEAEAVFRACVEQDRDGVWNALLPRLNSAGADRFVVGLPHAVLTQIQQPAIQAWIAEQPAERGALAASLVGKDLSSDDTLPAAVLGSYGDIEEVSDAFFSEYVTGTIWSGPGSEHWMSLAEGLELVAQRTKFAKLRRWARASAKTLRGMAERERPQEDEDALDRS